MTTNPTELWLIDEAEILLALETSRARRLWTPTRVDHEHGTGRDVVRIHAHDGTTEACFAYRGPTVVGLGDGDLERERERLQRIVRAAQRALANIDGHLVQRRGR